MNKHIYLFGSVAMGLAMSLTACSDDDDPVNNGELQPDGQYVGQTVGNFDKSEWYPGGELGTTDNVATGCYEDETPAVEQQGLLDDFNAGEKFFERQFTSGASGFGGLGPALSLIHI